jgi:UDP-2,3-diacylglucosamine pyrophosphatase LpxH
MDLEKNKNYFEIPSERVNVLTVSDLHKLHTAPSKKWIKKHDKLIDDTLEEALRDENIDAIVLNGDIFEGYETPYNKEEMKERIKEYITDLNKKNTRKIPIIYVVGNHDDKEYMVKTLKKLAKKIDNFHVYKEYVIIGNENAKVLFSHGDLYLRPDENPNKRKLGNQANHTFKPPFMEGMVYANLYALFRNFVQIFVDIKKSNPNYVIDTIDRRMEKEHPEIYNVVQAIITGHTHNPFIENKYGKLWGNTGTSVEKKRLNPIVATISSNGEVNLSFYRGANKGVGR